MCIFVASTEFSDYRFVLLSNRDEYFDRDTAPACVWSNGLVYGPEDLSKNVHGTWIGISQTGRIAVLVNLREETETESEFSRGALPSMFLQSTETPQEWLANLRKESGENISKCGGFLMLFGDLKVQGDNIAPLYLLSNRVDDSQVFGANGSSTICYSNGKPGAAEPWPKVTLAQQLAKESFGLHGVTLMENLWKLLTTNTLGESGTPTIEDVQNTIFVPSITHNGRKYGTRTQTVILVDKHGNIQYLEKNVQTGELCSKDWQADLNGQDGRAVS